MDFKIPQRHCARRSSSQLASNTGKSFGWAQIRCLISGMCASEHAALIRQKERTQSHQLFKQSAHTHTFQSGGRQTCASSGGAETDVKLICLD